MIWMDDIIWHKMPLEEIEDVRLRFVFEYVQLITEVKYDKVKKFFEDAAQYQEMMEFFENVDQMHLFVILSPSGVFNITTNFPDSLKFKTFYFVKREKITFEKSADVHQLASNLLYGELNKSPLHHFIAFVDTVMYIQWHDT